MTITSFFENSNEPYPIKYKCGCYQENLGQGYRLYPCIKHDKQILDLIMGDNS